MCKKSSVISQEGLISLATRVWLPVWENCGQQWLSAVYERDSHSQFDIKDMCIMALLEFGVLEGEPHEMDTVMLI